MKFGRNLPQNKVPEWSPSYIDYNGLKKLIQAIRVQDDSDGDVDLAQFLFYLDRNLEVVDDFYNNKFANISRRLKVLQERYCNSSQVPSATDFGENDDVVSMLLELRGQFRKLQWFSKVNRRGFVKITKKLDKTFPNSDTQQRYVISKVNQRPFSTDTELLENISKINDWLSAFGEIKSGENTISTSTTTALASVSSEDNILVPHGPIETVNQAIRDDNIHLILEELAKIIKDFETNSAQKLLINLLQRALFCKSKLAIQVFLKKIKSLYEPDDIHLRNCLHRFVISIARAESTQQKKHESSQSNGNDYSRDIRFLTPALIPSLESVKNMPTKSNQQILVNDYALIFDYTMENLLPSQRAAIVSKDIYGSMPLHYAAQLDFADISKIILKYMIIWNLVDLNYGIDTLDLRDNEGLAPLDLSVKGGHILTTQALLNFQLKKYNTDDTIKANNPLKLNRLIATATKFNFTSILKMLIESGIDFNWQDEAGETALHIAARFGHTDCAKILLRGNEICKASIELTEKKFSWTPLHVACVDGHYAMVEILIEKGANVNQLDACGWTAKEHAALRGHMTIARRLADVTPETEERNNREKSSCSYLPELPPSILSSMETTCSINSNSKSTESIKSFGHKYLTDRSLVLVNLGSMDIRKNIPAVQLEKIPMDEVHLTQLDTALSVIISAEGAKGESVIIDLPINDNTSIEPIIFTTDDIPKAKLYFDIVPKYLGSQKDKIGRGVALLSSFKQAIGVERVDLLRDVTIPILSTGLDVIGAINFNCLVITPFSHPNMNITAKQTYWKEISTTMVIGHRGLGKNLATNKSLQLGENTLQSFIAAANLGANYVEFDVQLTKDQIPVIYHDFFVSETGIDAPVHSLTLEQFLHVNDSISCTRKPSTSPNDIFTSRNVRSIRGLDRQRSMSLDPNTTEYDMSERMKHTRDFKLKGYKANSRGKFIQAPFTTLEEIFLKLPENIGFNIEMKYPMLHESESHEMDSHAIELNSFIDAVLSIVYELGKKRKIIFSSFNPDVCLMLNFKQPSIPILFLTDAGITTVSDIRASSLHEAIRFSRRWNLLGIVSAAEPFCNSPRLVKVVKENGLVCVSYGTLNNDPVKVQKQVDEGIDAIIVDNVLKIRNGLTKSATKSTTIPLT